ncbi:MAG: hypothetical protein ABJA20_03090 [Novosphingobium sp.]
MRVGLGIAVALVSSPALAAGDDAAALEPVTTLVADSATADTGGGTDDAGTTDSPPAAAVPAAGEVKAACENSSCGHGLPNFLNTAIQYGYSWDADNDYILGYGSDSKDRHQIRFEHQQTWKYGNVYFFLDRISAPTNLGGERNFGFPCCGDGKNAEVYAVFNGDVSLARVLDRPIHVGPFKDFSLSFRAEYGSFFQFKAVGLGLSTDVAVPGFNRPGDYVRLNWWRRFASDSFVGGAFDAGGVASTRYADHNLWGLTVRKSFDIGSTRFSHQTFLRYQQKATGNARELQRFNRIFMENELFVYLTDRLSVGFRSEYFRDAGGISFNGVKSDWRPIVAVKFDLFDR